MRKRSVSVLLAVLLVFAVSIFVIDRWLLGSNFSCPHCKTNPDETATAKLGEQPTRRYSHLDIIISYEPVSGMCNQLVQLFFSLGIA